jgi:putative endonuclease
VTAARRALGARGEDQAAAWYETQGYRVVARNWRCREGEIDLICAKDRRIVICEVKTRASSAFGHPAEAVTPAKARRLRGLAARWLADGEPPFRPAEIRFDVAAILAGEIEVIEAAF